MNTSARMDKSTSARAPYESSRIDVARAADGTFYMAASLNGRPVTASAGWSTRGAAYQAGADAVIAAAKGGRR